MAPIGYSIFDDKGEVKRLVLSVVQRVDPDIVVENMRKMDFHYIFTLSKGVKSREVELNRDEIDASWAWRSGRIDENLERKIEKAISEM